MGICYSEEEQWEAYNRQVREKRRNRRKNKNASIIQQENSIYERSFASKVENSFREDIYSSLQKIASEQSSIAIGSIVQMSSEEVKIVYQSVSRLNLNGELHNISEHVTLCNLKTKNFMHTHKICHPHLHKLNEVSCCPYNSNHIIEYDIWKFVKVEPTESQNGLESETDSSLLENADKEVEQGSTQNPYPSEKFFIYHPFTQRFLNFVKGEVVCTEEKKTWRVVSFGPRRNGGFIRIQCDEGQLCMTDERGLLTNHRRLTVCQSHHISHLWELQFGEIV